MGGNRLNLQATARPTRTLPPDMGFRQEAGNSGRDFNTFRCGHVLRACPLPTVSGNGITLHGNLWVTPGVLRRGEAAGNTSCL